MKQLNFTSRNGIPYVYDDCSGLIFPAESNAVDKIRSAETDYFGIHGAEARQIHEDVAEVRAFIEKSGVNQLLLETTARCNLRCVYCIYGKHYPETRSYHERDMDFATAKQAVDYYMSIFRKKFKRNPNATPSIGFYGGEPLLNFEVLRHVVEYLKSAYAYYPDIHFTITTNGMLLDKSIQKYLVENRFSIVVSLDGYKENHDRNRLTAEGLPTFDQVYSGIKAFKKKYPDYAKFGISTCFDYKTDLNRLDEFIRQEDLFVIKLSQVSIHNTTYYSLFSKADMEQHECQYEQLKQRYLRDVINGTLCNNSLLFPLHGIPFAEFAFHPMIREERPKFSPFTGTCVPGNKIYVTSDGLFHMCERVPHDMPIGSVDLGLDYERIQQLIGRYNENICKNCWSCTISRLCGICYFNVCKDGEFVLPDGYCHAAEERARNMLVDLMEILEQRPGHFEDITVDYFRTIIEKAGNIVE
jgi:uncharacterized protein